MTNSYPGREIRRRRMHTRRPSLQPANRQHNRRALQRPPPGNGGPQDQGQETRVVEHVPAPEPLQGGCWVQQLGVWIDG